jgi:pimeloyl-ACP methyl ester carboxylesterase
MKLKIMGVVAVLVATTAATPAAAAPPSIGWRDCGDGLQCGSIMVPADWSRHGGQETELGLAKLPAKDQDHKLGALLVNLGGPGPQISVFRQVQPAFSELTQWFDVIVADPRGFEKSSGIGCPLTAPVPADFVASDRAAYEDYKARNRQFGLECSKAAGALSGTLNSWQVAHDMDAIRAALGRRTLNYYGNSYGTVFGQAYAELFPRRVGRMYLDSVIDHTNLSVVNWYAERAAATERNLRRFADWCSAQASCALHGHDVLTVWDEVIAKAERRPIPAPRVGPDVTVTAARIVSRSFVSAEGEWPSLAQALAETHAGDASLFAEELSGARDPDLSRIMLCSDFPYPYVSDYRDVKGVEGQLRKVAPRLGWRQAWWTVYHCAGLPATPTFAPHPVRPRGLPPVLIANGEYDDTTPPRDGQRLAVQLPGARYLPAVGGHALYWSGDRCVRDHVHRYLTTGQLPPAGATCMAT